MEELGEKAEELKDNARQTLDESIDTIKEKAEEVMNNPDLKKTLDFIRANAVKAVTAAKNKWDEFTADPKVQEVSRKTAETIKGAADSFNEAVKPVVQNVDTFMNKPEVQETIANIRTTAADVTNKVVDTVSDLLNLDDEDTSKSEEDSKEPAENEHKDDSE